MCVCVYIYIFLLCFVCASSWSFNDKKEPVVFGMINAVASHGSHETAVDTFCLFLSVFEEVVLTILSHCLKSAEQHLDTNLIQNVLYKTKLPLSIREL